MRLPALLLSATATLGSCGDGPAENVRTEGTPVGLMTFWNAGTPIAGCSAATVTLTTMTCRTAALPLGTHNIKATFNGHQRYLGSASPFLAQVIN